MKKILIILVSISLSLNVFSENNKTNKTTVDKKIEGKTEEVVETFPDLSGSTCNFIKQKDIFLESVIDKLKKTKKTSDILCDSDDLKLSYYLLDEEGYSLNLGIGILATNTTKILDFNRNFENKLKEYKEFLNTLNIQNKTKEKIEKPKKIYIRFYGLVGDKRFFYIGKQEIGTNENKFYASPGIKSTADSFGFFKNIEVEYRNEQIIF